MRGRAEKVLLGGASLEEGEWLPLLWETDLEKCWELGTEQSPAWTLVLYKKKSQVFGRKAANPVTSMVHVKSSNYNWEKGERKIPLSLEVEQEILFHRVFVV